MSLALSYYAYLFLDDWVPAGQATFPSKHTIVAIWIVVWLSYDMWEIVEGRGKISLFYVCRGLP